MLIKLIGYMEINGPFYNFRPKLIKAENTDWLPWGTPQGGEFFPLVGSDNRHVDKALTNSQVICASYHLPYEGLSAASALVSHLRAASQRTEPPYPMEFPDGRHDELIRPASEEGFFPVLVSTQPTAGEPLQVGERISLTAGNTEIIPIIRNADRRPYQKGPAYVDSQVLIQEQSRFYGPLPVTAGTGGCFTVTRPEDAPSYRLRDQLTPHQIFEDTSENDHDYFFPKYVFLSDLVPDGGDAAADMAETPEAPQEDAGVQVEAPAEPEPVLDAKALADLLCAEIKKYRPGYSRNDIMSIAISLSQSFLTVFSGEPGTGKTSICNIFAQVLGLRETGRYVPVSVERGWTSKRDFIGYHNPLAVGGNTIVKANAQLYDALAGADKADAPLLVLLDEANLSPMEYYWSDFMDIAGSGEGEVNRTIDLGGDDGKLTISKKCRFAATINTDHTTEPLSPRIIDRAAVVVLPSDLQSDDKTLTQEGHSGQLWEALQAAFGGADGTVTLPGWKYTPGGQQLTESDHNEPCTWTSLQAAFDGRGGEDSATGMEAYRAVKAKLMWRPAVNGAQPGAEAPVKPLNVSISHRTEQAIQRFWAAARQEGVFEGDTQQARDTTALDYAVAQHLLPKLGGSGEGYAAALEQLRDLCAGYGLERSAGLLDKMLLRGGMDDIALNHYAFF